MHTPRIRCNYCGRRIPASSVVCPHCQRNPRGFFWKRWHVGVLALVLLAVAGIAAIVLGQEGISTALGSIQPIQVALGATTATPTFTKAPLTIVIVATQPASTPTLLPPTNTPLPPTETPSPTEIPSATTTVTVTPHTPVGTETAPPTPIPTPVPVSPPKLQAPVDGEQVRGANQHITLRFTPAAPIGQLEWFRVQVDFLDRAGQPVSWCAFTKESFLEFPREFFDDSSPNVRSFLWRVNVVRTNQFDPKTCDAPFELLSAPSDVWTFYWY